jgi:hypothetical protein
MTKIDGNCNCPLLLALKDWCFSPAVIFRRLDSSALFDWLEMEQRQSPDQPIAKMNPPLPLAT